MGRCFIEVLWGEAAERPADAERGSELSEVVQPTLWNRMGIKVYLKLSQAGQIDRSSDAQLVDKSKQTLEAVCYGKGFRGKKGYHTSSMFILLR